MNAQLGGLFGGVMSLASASGDAGVARAANVVSKGVAAANAVSALSSGNVLGGAMSLASGAGLAGLASTALGAFGASKAASILGSASSIMSAIGSGNVAGALLGGVSGLAGLIPGAGPAALALGTAMKLAAPLRNLMPSLPLPGSRPREHVSCQTCTPRTEKCDACGNRY